MTNTRQTRMPSSTPGVTLACAITTPRGRPAQGLVVLLSGSGPQDRNQTVAGQPSFRRLRESLAECGFATASWDDRGVGDSGGDYQASNSDQLVADALECAAALREQFDPALPLFLLGHSQGALVATKCVVTSPAMFNGLLLLAGAGRRGREVLLDQHRRICESEGWSEGDISSTLALKRAVFDELLRYPESLDAI